MNVQQRDFDRKQPPSVEPKVAAVRTAPKQRGFVSRYRAAIAVIVAVVVAGTGYAVFFPDNSNSPQPIIVEATRGDVEDLVTALGSLQPFASVDVGAQVSGQLKRIYVQVGDKVEQGQQLAEIDAAIATAKVGAGQAQLENYRAQLGEKQSNLALAKAQADRQERLMRDNATSQEAYDSAQAALKAAEAQVKSVTAQINQTQSTLKGDQATLSYTKIVAPVAGTVSNIVARQGQTLNANQTTPTIMTLADLSTMTVYTQASEADVPKLRIGMDAFFTTLGNPDKRYFGKLRQILPTPTVLNNVVLYTALFDVPNPGGELMTQMSAQVFFVRAEARDTVMVPVAAVQFSAAGRGQNAGQAGSGRAAGRRGGGRSGQGQQGAGQQATAAGSSPSRAATVTVVKPDGTTEIRNVIVGVSDRINAAILSGLDEGESVIVGTTVAGEGRGGRGAGQGGGRRGPVLFGG